MKTEKAKLSRFLFPTTKLEFIHFNSCSLRMETLLSDAHDGVHNKNFNMVLLDHPSEILTLMRGFHDVGLLDTPIYLRSVTFGTNKGTYGPYVMKISVNYKVKEFNFPVGVDRTFGGFHGIEHGHSIESIGVYVKAITSSMIAPRPHPRRIVVKWEQD
ncbi:hypothetical protein P3S67_018121 [Capsicum chacoense]